jgi:hypothetical protein
MSTSTPPFVRLPRPRRIPGAARVTPSASVALVTLALAAPGSALAGGGTNAVYQHRVVAVTGDTAPGLFAGTYTAFDLPSINASGQVAFFAETDGGFVDFGLWTTRFDDPQSLALVAGANLFVPGTPLGVRFTATEFPFVHPHLNDDGSIGFWMETDGHPDAPGEERGGLFRLQDDTIDAVVFDDEPVSGIPGVSFEWVGNLANRSSGGLFAFNGRLQGPGITEANDDVLAVEWLGGPTLIVREGGAALGLPGVTWRPIIPFGEPLIAADGRLTFHTDLSTFPSIGGHAIWQGFPGLLEPIAKTGDVLPNGQQLRRFPYPGGFMSNDAGTVVAKASFGIPEITGTGLFRFAGGDVETILITDDPAPVGTWAMIENNFSVDAEGTVFFFARLDGVPEDANTGLFRQRPGQPVELLVREGDQAFGSGPSVEIGDLSPGNASFTVDATGRAYLRADRRGPGMTPDWDDCVWMIDAPGSLSLVLRGQQTLTVAPFDTRFVGSVRFWRGDGPGAGNRGGVNDRGDMALKVNFQDGTAAIVHAYLPPFCPADRDGDGFITFDDLLIVLADFGNTGPVGTGGDADWDADTDFDDLLVILAAFGSACTPV